MVFSFFKKPPQKMPERPSARPRAPDAPPIVRTVTPLVEEVKPIDPLPDLEFTSASIPTRPAPRLPESEPVDGAEDLDLSDLDFDRHFTESSVMAIDLDPDGDPVQAEIEQVVVLFANEQDAVVGPLLASLVEVYHGVEGLRFWRLYFDFLQVTGDRAAFDRLGSEFALKCETSPPTWNPPQIHAVSSTSRPVARSFVLQGVLTAESAQPVVELAGLLKRKTALRIDCGKLISCDDEVAGQLASLLMQARRAALDVQLENAEALVHRLRERLIVGQAASEPTWLLLLELLQQISTQELFEEKAIDYAVTFELSPPSWEVPPARLAKSTPAATRPRDEAHYFSGSLKNCRFEELESFLEGQEQPVLDFSGVTRMDFLSAGQLVNRIAPYKAAGREILIRSPNHLVAELMAVVGLNKQARIIVPKS